MSHAKPDEVPPSAEPQHLRRTVGCGAEDARPTSVIRVEAAYSIEQMDAVLSQDGWTLFRLVNPTAARRFIETERERNNTQEFEEPIWRHWRVGHHAPGVLQAHQVCEEQPDLRSGT